MLAARPEECELIQQRPELSFAQAVRVPYMTVFQGILIIQSEIPE